MRGVHPNGCRACRTRAQSLYLVARDSGFMGLKRHISGTGLGGITHFCEGKKKPSKLCWARDVQPIQCMDAEAMVTQAGGRECLRMPFGACGRPAWLTFELKPGS